MSNITKDQFALIRKVIAVFFNTAWFELAIEGWKFGRKLWRGFADEGIYEVLDHQMTLELLDKAGKRAKVQKQQRVRYLQNDVASYLDQAWGDGEILINYKCSPGEEVDRYIEEHLTYILISLKGIRKRGDEDNVDIEWEFRDSFLDSTNQWSSEVSHRTKQFTIKVIFPNNRPPKRVWKSEYLRKKNQLLEQENIRKLSDGRWLASWEVKKPRLHERYSLKWEW